MLQKIAWILLVLTQDADLCRAKRVTHQQIEFAVDHRARLIQRNQDIEHAASSRQMFIHFAQLWIRFRGVMAESQPVPRPYSAYIHEFVNFMRDERGLSPVTITTRDQQITNFLEVIWRPGISLSAISVKDVDAYLAHQGNQGWRRASLHTLASTLRSFFRYAEGQKWCGAIAAAIEAPRLFAQEGLPLGPTWEEVQQLIVSTTGDRAVDIRDHAILLLLAVYGLRRGEVARLRLDDVNWEGEVLHVVRPKQRCTQHYPLVASVGNAIVRYLKETRPRCAYRELFMTLHAPVRPLLPASITPIVHSRLAALGVNIPRRGAHCLRHACAQHLLASGFSLKQIGDQLGHRSASATLHYARIDLNGLRQVAELDLGGVL
jgi:site-specific recombinase XerD